MNFSNWSLDIAQDVVVDQKEVYASILSGLESQFTFITFSAFITGFLLTIVAPYLKKYEGQKWYDLVKFGVELWLIMSLGYLVDLWLNINIY